MDAAPINRRIGRSTWGAGRDPGDPDDKPGLAWGWLARVVGWGVSGLAPLVALALALSQGGSALTILAFPILGAPPGPARMANTYSLIILVIAAGTLAIWGLWPGLMTLSEGALGLGIIIFTRHISTGALGGWLGIFLALTLVTLVTLVALVARREGMKREVALLRWEIAREKARVDAALNVTLDALTFYDSRGQVTQLNQEARRLFVEPPWDGAGAKGAPQATWMRDGRTLAREEWPDTRALRGEVIQEEALSLARGARDGPASKLEMLVSAAPILGPNGAIAGAVVSLRGLGEEGGARREWPPELNRRMDEFIGMASHELRTPLTTIKASVQLALRKLSRTYSEQTAADLRLILTRADQQVGRMTRLIENLLMTSRIASSRMTQRFERCDLLSLAREVIQDAQLRAPGRTIRLETDGAPALVWGDPVRLAQVIGAYLSNALKFSDPRQPVEVRVWGRWRADWAGNMGDSVGWQARVDVRDYGPGVSDEARAWVWERFFQDPALAARVGSDVGLGLGLYICREIVKAHSGAVGLEKARGRGTRFWFTVPALAE